MTDATPSAASGPLTVVLVHGAFADASNWAGVIPTLQAAGVDVLAPANPLRGIDHDAAYIASVASQIPGRSCWSATPTAARSSPTPAAGRITCAAWSTSRVHPGRGRDVTEPGRPGHRQQSPSGAAADAVSDRGRRLTAEFIIDPASFHEVFCADLPAEQAAILAVSQRPLAGVSFGEPTQNPAWKTLPRGRSSPPATSSSALPASASWPNAPAPRSPRSRARTP